MSVIKTLTHRGVDYDYHEWTTWNGKPASGYTITNHPTFAITSPRVQQLAAQTKEQAIEWAKKNNYQYFVEEPKQRKIKPKNYASNFDTNRKEPWTH